MHKKSREKCWKLAIYTQGIFWYNTKQSKVLGMAGPGPA